MSSVAIIRLVMAVAGLALLAWAGVSAFLSRRGSSVVASPSPVTLDRRRIYDAIIEQAEYARASGRQEIANAAVMAFTDLVRLEVKS